MRALWLLPLLAAPAAAQFAAPAAGARSAVAAFSAARDSRRDAALGAFGLTPETVSVLCADAPCPEARRAEVLSSLAGMLARMPRILAPARPPKLTWKDLPAGSAADGTTHGDASVTLYAPAGKDMSAILAHELGHVLETSDPKTPNAFLALRHDTPAYRDLLGRFWVEVWRARGPDDDESRPLPPRARQLLAEMRLPRRHGEDTHAAKSGREYWAVALELAYIEWIAGRAERLEAFMSAEEETFLRSRF